MSDAAAGDRVDKAASVILLRDAPGLEVLMTTRADGLAFAAGALVFPGGRVDSGDRDPAWADLADGLSDDPALAAGQIAAAREAFEEVGLLLARPAGAARTVDGARAAALGPHRRTVETEDGAFRRLVAAEDLRIAADLLQPFARWLPPEGIARRFDTLFFIARAPAGQTPSPDGREARDALWIAPAEAVAARAAGTRKIIFPTARNLERLALSDSVEAALSAARAQGAPTVRGEVRLRDGVRYVTIPEGVGYPVVEEPIDIAGRS